MKTTLIRFGYCLNFVLNVYDCSKMDNCVLSIVYSLDIFISKGCSSV